MMKARPKHIMVVDDHAIIRDGIRAMFMGQPGYQVIAEADGPKELFAQLREHAPDLILLDINMPKGSGLQCLEQLKAEYPEIAVLILSANTEESTIFKAVKLGCGGFLPKDCTQEELLAAIEKVEKGQNYFGKNIQEIIFRGYVEGVQGAGKSELSEREQEIVALLANGLSYKDIGQQLYISPRTVETHKKTIFKKLKFENKVDLIKYAIKQQIIDL